MAADFHEVSFPLRLALETSGGPVRRTDIVGLSDGRESRNARWRDARRAYDAGSGLRSVADVYAVVAFFEARRGRFHGFRFRDPLDHSSSAPETPVGGTDQVIGTGDGETRTFGLVKTYGDAGGAAGRRIFKPVAGSVSVALDGAGVPPAAYALDTAEGTVTFSAAPAAGAVVTAGFLFDVPVRFDVDRIDVNLSAFRAGRIPTIPLVEIRP